MPYKICHILGFVSYCLPCRHCHGWTWSWTRPCSPPSCPTPLQLPIRSFRWLPWHQFWTHRRKRWLQYPGKTFKIVFRIRWEYKLFKNPFLGCPWIRTLLIGPKSQINIWTNQKTGGCVTSVKNLTNVTYWQAVYIGVTEPPE